MKACPVCTTENPIEAHACTQCGTPLDQYALDEQVERATIEAKKRKLHKKEIAIGVGVLVILVILYNVFFGGPSVDRVETEKFYKAFIEVDGKEYQNFWKCVQRNVGRSARVMKDNLELYRALESAYNKAPAQYPGHVRERCIPRAKAFPVKMKELKLVDSLQPELDAYIESADTAAAAAEKFANEIEKVNEMGKLDAKVTEAGNAFHFDAEDSDLTRAFDHYLRCAIPEYDDKDMQGIVEYLFSVRKDPVKEVARWRKDCVPELDIKEGEPVRSHANYKTNVKKLGTDDRDVLAFADLFVRADKKSIEALMDIMGKAWMEYFNSWQGLRKRLGEVLGSD